MGKRFTAYDLPLAIFLVSAVVGLLPAYDRSLSTKTLFFLLLGGLLYMAVSRLAKTRARWDAAAIGLAVVTVLVSVYFVTQLGHMGFPEKIAPLSHYADAIARLTPNLSFWKPLGNTVGTFLEGGIFLLLGLALAERRAFPRTLLVIGLGFTALAVLLSASRGAWLAVLGAGLLWASLSWKPARWIAVFIGAGLVGLVGYVLCCGEIRAVGELPLVGGVLGPLFVRPDRLEVYYNSLTLISDVPFTGIGLGGQFGMVYSRYELLYHVPYLYNAHNLFLEIWLEQGLAGIFAWVWLAAAIFAAAYRWRVTSDPGARLRFEASWIGLVAVLIHGLVDSCQAIDPYTWLPFFTLLGLNAAMILGQQSQPEPGDRWLRYAPVGAAAAGLLLALASAWPLPVALRSNQAALIQHRAELSAQPGEAGALEDKAVSLFQTVLEKDPANRTANRRLGLIALSRHEYDHAAQYLEAALAADARHPGTRRALGLAYAFSGKLEKAYPLLCGQLNIVDELKYWGWHYNANENPQAGQNAYRTAELLEQAQPSCETPARPGGE